MERLTQNIQERLKTNRVCRVFANELNRVWPPSQREQTERFKRVKQIRQYAQSHGWSVIVRDAGIEATFKPDAPTKFVSQ
jgi:hypothetical protein